METKRCGSGEELQTLITAKRGVAPSVKGRSNACATGYVSSVTAGEKYYWGSSTHPLEA